MFSFCRWDDCGQVSSLCLRCWCWECCGTGCVVFAVGAATVLYLVIRPSSGKHGSTPRGNATLSVLPSPTSHPTPF